MIFPIKAVIFDADGVLLDSLSVWKELGKRYITDLGYQPVAEMDEIHRRRTRSAAARTAAHAKIRTVPLTSFQSPLETKIASVSCDPHNTLAIRFTYCLYRSIPFFSSINFPSKISCSTCLHGIRCNLLTSDASITRKVVW